MPGGQRLHQLQTFSLTGGNSNAAFLSELAKTKFPGKIDCPSPLGRLLFSPSLPIHNFCFVVAERRCENDDLQELPENEVDQIQQSHLAEEAAVRRLQLLWESDTSRTEDNKKYIHRMTAGIYWVKGCTQSADSLDTYAMSLFCICCVGLCVGCVIWFCMPQMNVAFTATAHSHTRVQVNPSFLAALCSRYFYSHDIKSINSQAAEQINNTLAPLRKPVAGMSVGHAVEHLKEFCWCSNLEQKAKW